MFDIITLPKYGFGPMTISVGWMQSYKNGGIRNQALVADILSYLKDRRFLLRFASVFVRPHMLPSERVSEPLPGSRSQSILALPLWRYQCSPCIHPCLYAIGICPYSASFGWVQLTIPYCGFRATGINLTNLALNSGRSFIGCVSDICRGH
jgi:hypothetical protein